MRLLMKRSATVSTEVRHLLDVGGKVVEALGPHEESFGHLWPPCQPDRLDQRRPVRDRSAMMIAIAGFGIQPAALSDRFQRCGLAATVFTDEEGDLAAKCQVDPASERADIERISRRVDLLGQALDATEKGSACGGPWDDRAFPGLHYSTMARGRAWREGLRPGAMSTTVNLPRNQSNPRDPSGFRSRTGCSPSVPAFRKSRRGWPRRQIVVRNRRFSGRNLCIWRARQDSNLRPPA